MDAVRHLAALLVLIMTAAAAAPITCVGWEGSPESRRECCKRAHHASCHDQTDADKCCARHEEGRLATVSAAADVAHVPSPALLAPMFASVLLAPPTTVMYATALTKQSHGPPNLLVLSLRI
jgi:hypothetical protein